MVELKNFSKIFFSQTESQMFFLSLTFEIKHRRCCPHKLFGSIPKWPLLTKMTVILHQNDRYFLPKWPLLYQNDRYKLHQNDRYFYQNDRYLGPKWPLPKWPLWTKMTVIYKHQNDRYFVLKWPLCEQNNRYLDQKWSFCLTVILVLNNGHFGP